MEFHSLQWGNLKEAQEEGDISSPLGGQLDLRCLLIHPSGDFSRQSDM